MLAGGLDPKLRVYDLRHINTSAMLAAGEQLLTVSKRVGHKSAKKGGRSRECPLFRAPMGDEWHHERRDLRIPGPISAIARDSTNE